MIDQLSGGAALGFYQLYLNLTLHVEAASTSNDPVIANTPYTSNDPVIANTPYTLTDFRADVRLGHGLLGMMIPPPQNLPVAPAGFTQERSIQLRMDLDRSRIEAIEAVRGGQDMQLALMVYAQAASCQVVYEHPHHRR